MNVYELKQKALSSEERECILGFRETGSYACYMIFGFLKPHESGRVIKPGNGHEEIVLAMKGDFKVTGYYEGDLREGSAFHIHGDQECFLENTSGNSSIYIIAGGHSDGNHH